MQISTVAFSTKTAFTTHVEPNNKDSSVTPLVSKGTLISCRGGRWTEPPRGQELSVGDSCRGAVQLGKADGEPLVVALGLVLKNADA